MLQYVNFVNHRESGQVKYALFEFNQQVNINTVICIITIICVYGTP